MANQVDKINGLTLTNIQAVNGLTDANIQAVNGLTMVGTINPSVTSLTNAVYESGGDAIAPTMAFDNATNTIGVCYGDGSNSDYPTVKLATIDGSNALDWGQEVVVQSSAASGVTCIAYDPNADVWVAGAATTPRNAPTVKAYGGVDNDGNDTINEPYLTTPGTLQVIYSPDSGKYVDYSPVGNFIIYDDYGSGSTKRFLASFVRNTTATGYDNVMHAFTVDGSNDITVGSQTEVEANEPGDSALCWDSTASRVVRVGQHDGSPYHVTAQVITGSGTTVTVGTAVEYANHSVGYHNSNHAGSSLSRMRYDNTTAKVVHANGVNHCLFWDDIDNDFVVSNFSVSGTTVTWNVDGSDNPIRSEGIMSEHSGNLTDGKTSGWGEDDYETYSMGASSSAGRNRIIIFGSGGTDTNCAVLEYTGSGTSGAYAYKGSLLELVGDIRYKMQDASGYQATDFNGFLANHVFFTGQEHDESDDGRLHAVDLGTG